MSQVSQFVQQLMQPLKCLGRGHNPRAYTQGLTPYRQKQWQQAVECFTQAAVEQPDHAPSHFKLGMSHFRLKEYEAALTAITRALELDPSQKQWQEQLGQVARHVAAKAKQSPSEKEQTIRDQIERLDNPSGMLYNQLAHSLRKQGKWWQEVEALKSAIAIEDHHPTWHYRLGEAQEVMNRYQQAAEAYSRAIELKQGEVNATWYYRQGYCYAREGHDSPANQTAAEQAYNAAIEKDTKLNAKRFGIGVFHQQRGDWQLAHDAYLVMMEQKPWDEELTYRMGLSSDHCCEWVNAERYYKQALTLEISRPEWHFRLGLILEKQGKLPEATLAYHYAVLLREKHTPYWYYRWACALEQQGKLEEAVQVYLQTRQQQALYKPYAESTEVGTNNHQVNNSFEDDALIYYTDQFKNENWVINKLMMCLENNKTDPLLWFRLGNAYEREANWNKAIEAYSNANFLLANNTEKLSYRQAYCFYQSGNVEDSVEVFKSIDYQKGLHNRIKKEFLVEMIRFDLENGIYTIGLIFKNKSIINPNVCILNFLITHRMRIGNEVDEFLLPILKVTSFGVEGYLEFIFNPRDYDIGMHYWDFYIQVQVSDDVYGNLLIDLPLNRYSDDVLRKIDENPWELAVKDEECILHPYKTVGGKKIAFLKRPQTEYDDIIYCQREQQAIKEYLSNKDELENKKAWLIFEKFSKTAQDNGFYFFKHAVKRRPHVYYVIEKGSPDLKYLKEHKKNVVEFMSVEHMKLLLSCEKIISSEGRGHGYAWRRISGIFKENLLEKEYAFLQHGVIGLKKLGSDFSKNNKNFAANFFLSSTEIEKEIISKEFNYDASNMILAGLPRWSGFKDQSFQYNEIFLMPSWRNWLEDINTTEFIKTEYFKAYKKLLTSPKLLEVLEKNTLVLNFYLHPKVIGLLYSFVDDNPRINFVDFGEVTVRDLLQRSKLLITDYSSVAWDFIYLEKPVAFYHFDIDKYEELQGAYLDLRKNILGQSHYHEESLISGIADIIENYSYHKKLTMSIKESYLYYQPKNINEHIYQVLIARD